MGWGWITEPAGDFWNAVKEHAIDPLWPPDDADDAYALAEQWANVAKVMEQTAAGLEAQAKVSETVWVDDAGAEFTYALRNLPENFRAMAESMSSLSAGMNDYGDTIKEAKIGIVIEIAANAVVWAALMGMGPLGGIFANTLARVVAGRLTSFITGLAGRSLSGGLTRALQIGSNVVVEVGTEAIDEALINTATQLTSMAMGSRDKFDFGQLGESTLAGGIGGVLGKGVGKVTAPITRVTGAGLNRIMPDSVARNINAGLGSAINNSVTSPTSGYIARNIDDPGALADLDGYANEIKQNGIASGLMGAPRSMVVDGVQQVHANGQQIADDWVNRVTGNSGADVRGEPPAGGPAGGGAPGGGESGGTGGSGGNGQTGGSGGGPTGGQGGGQGGGEAGGTQTGGGQAGGQAGGEAGGQTGGQAGGQTGGEAGGQAGGQAGGAQSGGGQGGGQAGGEAGGTQTGGGQGSGQAGGQTGGEAGGTQSGGGQTGGEAGGAQTGNGGSQTGGQTGGEAGGAQTGNGGSQAGGAQTGGGQTGGEASGTQSGSGQSGGQTGGQTGGEAGGTQSGGAQTGGEASGTQTGAQTGGEAGGTQSGGGQPGGEAGGTQSGTGGSQSGGPAAGEAGSAQTGGPQSGGTGSAESGGQTGGSQANGGVGSGQSGTGGTPSSVAPMGVGAAPAQTASGAPTHTSVGRATAQPTASTGQAPGSQASAQTSANTAQSSGNQTTANAQSAGSQSSSQTTANTSQAPSSQTGAQTSANTSQAPGSQASAQTSANTNQPSGNQTTANTNQSSSGQTGTQASGNTGQSSGSQAAAPTSQSGTQPGASKSTGTSAAAGAAAVAGRAVAAASPSPVNEQGSSSAKPTRVKVGGPSGSGTTSGASGRGGNSGGSGTTGASPASSPDGDPEVSVGQLKGAAKQALRQTRNAEKAAEAAMDAAKKAGEAVRKSLAEGTKAAADEAVAAARQSAIMKGNAEIAAYSAEDAASAVEELAEKAANQPGGRVSETNIQKARDAAAKARAAAEKAMDAGLVAWRAATVDGTPPPSRGDRPLKGDPNRQPDDPTVPLQPEVHSLGTYSADRLTVVDGVITEIDGQPVETKLRELSKHRAELYYLGKLAQEPAGGDTGNVVAVVLNVRTGQVFEATNGQTETEIPAANKSPKKTSAANPVHPTLRALERQLRKPGHYPQFDYDGMPEPGQRMDLPGIPNEPLFRHAEVRAANEHLHVNDEVELSDLLADVWRTEEGGPVLAPFCPNCSGVIPDVRSLSGRREYSEVGGNQRINTFPPELPDDPDNPPSPSGTPTSGPNQPPGSSGSAPDPGGNSAPTPPTPPSPATNPSGTPANPPAGTTQPTTPAPATPSGSAPTAPTAANPRPPGPNQANPSPTAPTQANPNTSPPANPPTPLGSTTATTPPGATPAGPSQTGPTQSGANAASPTPNGQTAANPTPTSPNAPSLANPPTPPATPSGSTSSGPGSSTPPGPSQANPPATSPGPTPTSSGQNPTGATTPATTPAGSVPTGPSPASPTPPGPTPTQSGSTAANPTSTTRPQANPPTPPANTTTTPSGRTSPSPSSPTPPGPNQPNPTLSGQTPTSTPTGPNPANPTPSGRTSTNTPTTPSRPAPAGPTGASSTPSGQNPAGSTTPGAPAGPNTASATNPGATSSGSTQANPAPVNPAPSGSGATQAGTSSAGGNSQGTQAGSSGSNTQSPQPGARARTPSVNQTQPGSPGAVGGPNSPAPQSTPTAATSSGGLPVGTRSRVQAVRDSRFSAARVALHTANRVLKRAFAAMNDKKVWTDAGIRKVTHISATNSFVVTRADANGTYFIAHVVTAKLDGRGPAEVVITDAQHGKVEIRVSTRVKLHTIDRVVADAIARASAILQPNARTTDDALNRDTHPGDNVTLSVADQGQEAQVRSLDRTREDTARFRVIRRRRLANEMQALVEQLGMHPDDDVAPQRNAVSTVGGENSIIERNAETWGRRPAWAKPPTGYPTWRAFAFLHLPAEWGPGAAAGFALLGTGAPPAIAYATFAATAVNGITGTITKRWYGRKEKTRVDTGHGVNIARRAHERGERRRELIDEALEHTQVAGISSDPQDEPELQEELPAEPLGWRARFLYRGLPTVLGSAAGASFGFFGLPIWNVGAYGIIAVVTGTLGPKVEEYVRKKMVPAEWTALDEAGREADEREAELDEQIATVVIEFLDRIRNLAGNATNPDPPAVGDVDRHKADWPGRRHFGADQAVGQSGDTARSAMDATGKAVDPKPADKGTEQAARPGTDAANKTADSEGIRTILETAGTGVMRSLIGAAVNMLIDKKATSREYEMIVEQVRFDFGNKAAEQMEHAFRIIAEFATALTPEIEAAEADAGVVNTTPATQISKDDLPDVIDDADRRPVGRQGFKAFLVKHVAQGGTMMGAMTAAWWALNQPDSGLIVIGSVASAVAASFFFRWAFRRAEQNAVDTTVLRDRDRERPAERAEAEALRQLLIQYGINELVAALEGRTTRNPTPQVHDLVDPNDPNNQDYQPTPGEIDTFVQEESLLLANEPRPAKSLGSRLVTLRRLTRLAQRVRAFEVHARDNGNSKPLEQARADMTALYKAYQDLKNQERDEDGRLLMPPPDHEALLKDAAERKAQEKPPGFRGGEPGTRPAGDLQSYLDKRTKTRAGRAFFTPDEMPPTAKAVRPEPGQYTIDMHGGPGYVRIGRTVMTADDLAALIEADPYWRGEPIRLLPCETGLPDQFAQQLADRLGVRVYAPNDYVFVNARGSVYVTGFEIGQDGRAVPKMPPTGKMVAFDPAEPRDHSHRSNGPAFPDTPPPRARVWWPEREEVDFGEPPEITLPEELGELTLMLDGPTVYTGSDRLWPDELADLVAENGDWTGGPTRLQVRDGQVDPEFVQRLADLLGVPVVVPADAVAGEFPTLSSGTLEVYNEPSFTGPPPGCRVYEPRNVPAGKGTS